VLANTAEVRRSLLSAEEDGIVALVAEGVGCGALAVVSEGAVVALTVEDGIVPEASSVIVRLED
jgi:hypothetical protein